MNSTDTSPIGGMTESELEQLVKELPNMVRPKFADEVKVMSRKQLQRKLLICADWNGAYSRCLDGIKEIAYIGGGGIDNCRMPDDIKRIVQTLVTECPTTWEDNWSGRLKTPAAPPSQSQNGHKERGCV